MNSLLSSLLLYLFSKLDSKLFLLISFHLHNGFYAPLTFFAYLSELKDYDWPLPAHMKRMRVQNTVSWNRNDLPLFTMTLTFYFQHHMLSSVLHTQSSKPYRADQTPSLYPPLHIFPF